VLVLKRHFRICQEKLKEMGVKEGKMEVKEYEGWGMRWVE
jgi:hypothetical protein